MHILIFANCITAACQARRGNARYDAPAGRRKVLLLADYFARLGHTTEIVSPSYAKRRDGEFIETIAPGVQVRHAPVRTLFGVAPARQDRAAEYNRNVVETYRGRRDVLVISYNYHREYGAALLAARACGLKTLLEYEDGIFLDAEWRTPEGLAWEKDIYAASDACLVVNDGLAARVREVAGAKAPPCHVLPGLPDLGLLANAPTSSPPGETRLLFSGNFTPEHGFAQLRAWIENLPDTMQLDITGRAGEAETATLRELIASRPHVRFHGFTSEEALHDLQARADACVLIHNPDCPYHRTQFPSKFFDCLSRNKRIVSAPDSRIESFRNLSHLVIAPDFPRGIRNLPALLRAAPPPRPEEVACLGTDLLSGLGGFLGRI